MKVVFAPWRMEFIKGERELGCVFCTRAKRKTDSKDFILYRGKHNFVILNVYPYNNGHLMVIPYRHTADFSKLTAAESKEMMALLQKSTRVMKKALASEGVNIGFNLGKAAGAGIADHLHGHVIPRWFADTNFWPVIAEAKTMPEHLRTTYIRMKKAWRSA